MKTFKESRSHLIIVLTTLSLSACEAQQSPRYAGDALASISGELRNSEQVPVPPSELVLVWAAPRFQKSISKDIPEVQPEHIAEKLAVSVSFPNDFTFEIHSPPADITHLGAPENAYAFGQLRVVRAGAVETGPVSDVEALNEATLTLAEAGILWLGDTPSADLSEQLGGASAAGFYLYRYESTLSDAEIAAKIEECKAAAPNGHEESCEQNVYHIAYKVMRVSDVSERLTIDLSRPSPFSVPAR